MNNIEDKLAWRGIEDPEDVCVKCGGSGHVIYGSTATWRGGVGGQMMTDDVCDSCWGSGSKSKPWTDLRKLRSEEKKRIEKGAAKLLENRLGASLKSLQPTILAISKELDRLARKRKPPTGDGWFEIRNWEQTCEILARELRLMVV